MAAQQLAGGRQPDDAAADDGDVINHGETRFPWLLRGPSNVLSQATRASPRLNTVSSLAIPTSTGCPEHNMWIRIEAQSLDFTCRYLVLYLSLTLTPCPCGAVS